jgi:electron transfer flavoprotein alpha subunit
MARNVLVVAETRDGSLRNVSLEALAAAKRIAEGGGITAVLFGSQADRNVQALGQYGADKVVVVTNHELDLTPRTPTSRLCCR